ncbi:hypothetical protein BFP72_08590 [Reichenbachiella sp. 5M10]|uniref:redoxin domain-containing protein n=1 Tax=Reichenbachiella sp. 5M10 TaxID=1889772 RepID=UPI000C1581F1|nr:redoxin domain-containing protein [Reichenbachiella sp. 5M10]PIB35447.1 hypothetical protein BFP72_08590 [Reichenbachiella sp. 5M10]
MKNFLLIFAIILGLHPLHAQNVGDKAPDFSYDIYGGGTFNLSHHQGKVVFVFVFGSGCPHCNSNGSNTESGIYQKYKDHPKFAAVGVDTWDGNNSAMQVFQKNTGITYPLCLNASDMESKYNTTYDRILVIDTLGILRYKSTANATSSVVQEASDVISSYLKSENDGDPITSTSLPSNGLQLYPIPSSNQLTLASEQLMSMNATVRVLDLTGRQYAAYHVRQNTQGKQQVSLVNLPKGVNILEVTYDDQTTVRRRFVKN